MKTKHRSRKNTKKPQPGTPGAPFLGAFIVKITPTGTTGACIVEALLPNETGTGTIPFAVWPGSTSLDVGAFGISGDGVPISINSAITNPEGTIATLLFTPYDGTVVAIVEPGHPGLLGIKGIQCGGGFGEG